MASTPYGTPSTRSHEKGAWGRPIDEDLEENDGKIDEDESEQELVSGKGKGKAGVKRQKIGKESKVVEKGKKK